MEWLWIPAVVILVLFVLVLCWLFFSKYTCCPCRHERSQETVLPTTAPTCQVPTFSRSGPPSVPHRYPLPPSRRNDAPLPPSKRIGACVLPPSGSPHLHLRYADLPLRQVVRSERGIPTLDLHNMTVREATQVTEAFIQENRGKHRKVQIITGRGLHSADGVSKIKPAVSNLLMQRNIYYREVHNGGCFEVTLSH